MRSANDTVAIAAFGPLRRPQVHSQSNTVRQIARVERMRNPSPGKDRDLDVRLDAPGRRGFMALLDAFGPSGGTIPDPSVGLQANAQA